jgi:signal transduction histidine kinase/CheY-like chemotaxis protein
MDFNIKENFCSLLLLASCVFSMNYFLNYSIEFSCHIVVVTGFFVFYAFIVLNSVFYLLDAVEVQYLRYKTVLDRISSTFIISDDSLFIKFCKNGKFLKEEHKDLVGRSVEDFKFYSEKHFNLLKESGDSQMWTFSDVDSNGNEAWFFVNATRTFIPSFKNYEINILIHDVSMEKKVQQQEKINIKNKATMKAKNEFIASISHEIRNPIQVIIYNSEELLTKKLQEEELDMVLDISRSANLIISIIGDILDISKIEAGKMKIVKSVVNTLQIIESSISMNCKNCFEKNLQMNVFLDFQLPTHFIGDNHRILQVMNNFVSNAVKFTKSGEINLHTLMINHNDQKFFRFECKDSGIGISKKDIKSIFSPFCQSDSSIPNESGFGLGLSICKLLLSLMGGTYGVESEESKGSTFWFEIPMFFEGEFQSFENAFKQVVSPVKEVAVVSHRNVGCFDFLRKFSDLIGIKLEMNPESFSMNQTVLVEEDLVGTIPKNISPSKLILLTTKQISSEKKCLKFPLLPSIILKWISEKPLENKSEQKLSINRNLRILVVDDNILILKSLERLLKNLGLKNITTAKDGQDALEIVKINEPFDIIFMDISMPIMNGIEATKEIRKFKQEKKRKSYIVALTGNALPMSLEEQSIEWKMDGILTKPATKQEIIQILNKFTFPAQK